MEYNFVVIDDHRKLWSRARLSAKFTILAVQQEKKCVVHAIYSAGEMTFCDILDDEQEEDFITLSESVCIMQSLLCIDSRRC